MQSLFVREYLVEFFYKNKNSPCYTSKFFSSTVAENTFLNCCEYLCSPTVADKNIFLSPELEDVIHEWGRISPTSGHRK
jgi:hypothetical protein